MGVATAGIDQSGCIATFEVDFAYPRRGDETARLRASVAVDADEVAALLRAFAECIRVCLLAGRILAGL